MVRSPTEHLQERLERVYWQAFGPSGDLIQSGWRSTMGVRTAYRAPPRGGAYRGAVVGEK